jgi:hypothetical protein
MHGGVYVVDLARQAVYRTLEQTSDDIEWFGDEGGRGLRGIAFDGDTVYIAASNQLLAFDKSFKPAGAWRNPNLVDCHGICIFERKLYLASTGNDCILAFDLDEKAFTWAMHIQSSDFQFRAAAFDPNGSDHPLPINKLHLKSVVGSAGGLRIAGLNTGGVLHYNGETIHMSVQLPEGAQDARLFRNGVVFNDSRAGVLRYSGQDDGREDRALQVPFFTPEDHDFSDPDATRMLKRGYARGLCVLSGTAVAGGSTPAGVSIYDLRGNSRLMTVTFTRDVREAINCIEVWPD